MTEDIKGRVLYNDKLIDRLVKEGDAIVFTLCKKSGGREILTWNTAPRFFPPEMKDNQIRIGYMLENAKNVGLDDLAMPDQPTDEKLIEECHELTAEEIEGFYATDVAKNQGTLWNVDKNYSSLFMTKDTYDEVLATCGRGVSLVFPCADCAVVRFYDPEHNVIGLTHSDAIHTGRNVIPKSVLYMREKFGTDPQKLQVFVGAFAYEGWTYDSIPNFAAKKNEAGEVIGLNETWDKYIVCDSGKYLINYGDIIFDQLISCGLNVDNISFSPDNTLTNDDYFSNSRSFNSKVDGVVTYREGRNMMGISFAKKKVLELREKQNTKIR